jgi:hypothetical protein
MNFHEIERDNLKRFLFGTLLLESLNISINIQNELKIEYKHSFNLNIYFFFKNGSFNGVLIYHLLTTLTLN